MVMEFTIMTEGELATTETGAMTRNMGMGCSIVRRNIMRGNGKKGWERSPFGP